MTKLSKVTTDPPNVQMWEHKKNTKGRIQIMATPAADSKGKDIKCLKIIILTI